MTGGRGRRLLTVVLTGAALAIGSFEFVDGAAGATLAASTACSNGVGNAGGLGVICNVTIDNRISAGGSSATVTVQECHGPAGNPSVACTTTTRILTEPVTSVIQCNDAMNGGGGTLRCSVSVINTFVGVSGGATPATVDQCAGSGGGITTGCSPFPGTTSGATITQCNGSANGGTLVGLTCTVTGTASPALGVAINQCNSAANGGRALVICSASITNRTEAGSLAGPIATLPPTDVVSARGGAASPPPPMLAVLAVLLLIGTVVTSGLPSLPVRRDPR